MKVILNWRYYVIYGLIINGLLFTIFAFGDDNRTMTEWLKLHLPLFGVGIGSFFAMGKLLKYWKSKDLIPEFNKECEDE